MNRYYENDYDDRYDDYYDTYSYSSDESVGEITGRGFSEIEEAQGMPMRGFMDTGPRKRDLNPAEMGRTDFDLYTRSVRGGEDRRMRSVSYFDQDEGGRGASDGFSNFRTGEGFRSQSSQVRIDPTISYGQLFQKLVTYFIMPGVNNLIAPFSLYNGLLFLYLSSNSHEIGRLLGIGNQPKQMVYESVTRMLLGVKKALGSLSSVNLCLIPNRYGIDNQFVDVASLFTRLHQYDPNNSQTESRKIGGLISGSTKSLIKETVDESVLSKGGMIVHSTTIINLKLARGSPAGKRPFFGPRTTRLEMVAVSGDILGSVTNDSMVYEIPLDQRILFGVCQTRVGGPVNNQQLAGLIGQTTRQRVECLILPKITKTGQISYGSFLKRYGVSRLFTQEMMSELLSGPNNLIELTRYYQTIKIHTSVPTHAPQTNARMPIIINKPFTYWVRDRLTGLFIVIGFFDGS